VYGFVSMVSSVASENDRMESQINAIAGGTYK
jgi:hypothetical protein